MMSVRNLFFNVLSDLLRSSTSEEGAWKKMDENRGNETRSKYVHDY